MMHLTRLVATIAVMIPPFEVPLDSVEFWRDSSVICAKILDYEQVAGKGQYVTIKPLASISGTIDPTSVTELKLRARIGPGSALRTPEKGKQVICVVETINGEPAVCEGSLLFLRPHGHMVVIDGLGDPKVQEITERVRDLKAKARRKESQARDE